MGVHDADGVFALMRVAWSKAARAFRCVPTGFDGSNYAPISIDADGALRTSTALVVLNEALISVPGSGGSTSIAANSDRTGGIWVVNPDNGTAGTLFVSVETDRATNGIKLDNGSRILLPTAGIVYLHRTGVGSKTAYYIEWGSA